MGKKFYISTSILYTSAIPHIGNLYEIILTDAIVRFKRLEGYDVYFQTGTDEHGQKIEKAARLNNLEPIKYSDYISSEIKKIFDTFNISYDYFFRTTSKFHEEAVQQIFDKLLKKGDIYLGHYEGYYSLAEESFVMEKDLIDGRTKLGDEPIWTSEEVYFFKFSKYQDWLINYIKSNPDFIKPEIRKNEILSFLKEPLYDVSVTRSKFKWGIPILNDKNHIVYVWIDALTNYITSLGYPKIDSPNFKKYWPCDCHIVGKDILRFHAIYWPIILNSLNLPIPKKIFAHPWILVDKKKMSKSLGTNIFPDFLVKHFSVDEIRYFCLSEIPYAQDGNLTYELIIERSNSDLCNTLGNLLNRTIGMIKKYRGGVLKKVILNDTDSKNLENKCLGIYEKVKTKMDEYNVSGAIFEIMELARFANKYVDLKMPWQLFKDKKDDELDNCLYHLIETIRFLSIILDPFIPETAKKIREQINYDGLDFKLLNKFGLYDKNPNDAVLLFPRYDISEKLKEVIEDENNIKKEQK